jgi:hypothetical protein
VNEERFASRLLAHSIDAATRTAGRSRRRRRIRKAAYRAAIMVLGTVIAAFLLR